MAVQNGRPKYCQRRAVRASDTDPGLAVGPPGQARLDEPVLQALYDKCAKESLLLASQLVSEALIDEMTLLGMVSEDSQTPPIDLDKMKIDDPVGAISVHGVVGFLGLMLVPITNPLTEDGGSSFSGQLIGAATIFIWVFVASLVVWGILKAVIGIRVSEEDEYEGVDLSECGMEAYPEFTKGS